MWPGDWFDANPYGSLYTLPGGNRAYHTGADLNKNRPTWDDDRGKPVQAAASGIVTFAGRLPVWGGVIVIKHDPLPTSRQVVFSRSGHVFSITVRAGQRVNRGDQIAVVGRDESGGPYHLHFDLSPTEVLLANPGDWPGLDRTRLLRDYMKPRAFIVAHRPSGYHGPAVSKFVPGIDQPASDWRWPAAREAFNETGLWPKFHTGGENADWFKVRPDGYRHPSFNLVRILLAPDFRGGAGEIFDETQANVRRFYERGARDFVVLNEPNIEGMNVRWKSGTEFGLVFHLLCQRYKDAFPSIRLWFPGMSPGFGAQHEFIAQAKMMGAFGLVDGVVEHVYTGIADNVFSAVRQMREEVEDFQRQWALDKPLVIGEFSVNRPAAPSYKAQVYRDFYGALEVLPGLQAAYSFTSSWFPNPDRNLEGWLETGIHREYAKL